MWIKKEYDYNDLKENSWSGAVNTLRRIEEANKEDALMDLLENLFSGDVGGDVPDATIINDFLWFESDYIYKSLGISDNEDDEDDEVTPEDLDKFAR